MKISKDSFVFQIAFMDTKAENLPKEINLCRIVSRFAGFFLLWLFVVVPFCCFCGLLFFIFVAIITGCTLAFTFLCGWTIPVRKYEAIKIPVLEWELPFYFFNATEGFRVIETNWLRRLGQTIGVVLLSVIVLSATYFVFLSVRWIVGGIAQLVEKTGVPGWLEVALVATGIVVALWFIYRYCYGKFRSSEIGQVIIAYLKAKKEKVCPIIEVE